MSSAPTAPKRPRGHDSDGEEVEDHPESGQYHPTAYPSTHPFNRPLAPPQHRPGSSRPRQFSQYSPTDPLLSVHVELKSPPKKRGRPSKKKPETAAGETAALPAADPNAPAPAATADSAAPPPGTSTGDAPAQPVKRGRGRPRKVSSAFPNRVRPSPCPT